jgi:hypothetical protein
VLERKLNQRTRCLYCLVYLAHGCSTWRGGRCCAHIYGLNVLLCLVSLCLALCLLLLAIGAVVFLLLMSQLVIDHHHHHMLEGRWSWFAVKTKFPMPLNMTSGSGYWTFSSKSNDRKRRFAFLGAAKGPALASQLDKRQAFAPSLSNSCVA